MLLKHMQKAQDENPKDGGILLRGISMPLTHQEAFKEVLTIC